MELNNAVAVLRGYQSATVGERNDDLVVDRHRLDPLTGRNLVDRTMIRDGRVRRATFFTRLFMFPELRDWMRQAGFASVAGHGEDGGPLTAESRRMIVIAERA